MMGQIGPRGDVSGSGVGGSLSASSMASLKATRVTCADQGVGVNSLITWNSDSIRGCYNNGCWSSLDPTKLTATVVTNEIWAVGLQIGMFENGTNIGNFSFSIFIAGTAGLATAGLAVPVSYCGVLDNSAGTTSWIYGNNFGARTDFFVTSSGTLILTAGRGSEGDPTPIIRGARSYFSLIKLRG